MGFRCGHEITALVLAIAITGCSARVHPPQSTLHVDAEALAAELEDAYCTSSPEKLAAFLRKWHNSLQPKNIEGIKDPIERELYSVFQGFFNPFELNTVAGREGYADVSEVYRRVTYVIVQGSVRLQVGDGPERTVRDFRPRVDFDKVDSLYLTPTYREALVAFLEADDSSGLIDVEKSIQRIQFLQRFVCVHPAHWTGWDLETPPTIDSVKFDERTTKATLRFSILSDHGCASMERTPDGWHVSDTGIYAIE